VVVISGINMSEKHDKLATVKLDPESLKAVDDFRKKHPFRVSRNAVANAMVMAGSRDISKKGRP